MSSSRLILKAKSFLPQVFNWKANNKAFADLSQAIREKIG
jgi:hypothetical protein